MNRARFIPPASSLSAVLIVMSVGRAGGQSENAPRPVALVIWDEPIWAGAVKTFLFACSSPARKAESETPAGVPDRHAWVGVVKGLWVARPDTRTTARSYFSAVAVFAVAVFDCVGSGGVETELHPVATNEQIIKRAQIRALTRRRLIRAP